MRSRNRAFPDVVAEYSDIQDPTLLREHVIRDLNNRKFGWGHVRAILVAGSGFLTDSYDIFAINLVSDMIGFCYFADNVIPQRDDTAIKVVASVGALLGQLFFGWLADVIGRKRMYGYELLIIVLATFGQSITGPSRAASITSLLIFWRLLMGIGIGGDYPLANIITTEFASTKWRGAMVAAVFSTQALGQFMASLVALIVTEAFKSEIEHVSSSCQGIECHQSKAAVDRMWRIIIGFGAVPAVFAVYCRLTIPETPRFTFDVNRDPEQAAADWRGWAQNTIGLLDDGANVPAERETLRAQLKETRRRGHHLTEEAPQRSWKDCKRYLARRRNWSALLGTCGSWFCLDVAYYSLTLNNTIFLQRMGFGSVLNTANQPIYRVLREGAVGNLVLVTAGAIPGSIMAIFLVDKIGRKPIQLLGFAMMTILLFVLGSAFTSMSNAARVAIFVLCLFFSNFGPNSTTFIVPGECFPTRYRSTAHGVSAASGKVGAVLAQSLTGPLREIGSTPEEPNKFLPHVIQILGAFATLGFLFSLLIPETMGKSLESLSGEGEGEDDDDELSYLWKGLLKLVPGRLRDQTHSSGHSDAGSAENISLTVPRDDGPPTLQSKATAGEEGWLKVVEREVDRSSGGSSERARGSGDDSIQRIG